jgi:hypothetical protein
MVTPNPKPPKLPKPKKGSKAKGFSDTELRRYLLAGGSLTDIAGTKITQGQVISALSDPMILQVVLANLASDYGNAGSYNPEATYGSDVPTFEASFNPVKSKYANLQGVQAQIANDLFESIDAGTDPTVAASKLLDNNFLKTNYGVDSSQIGTLGANLMTDAEDYVDAESKRKTAMQKQNYDAWRKSIEETGATPSEYLSKSLGIPALRNLPDPTKAYGTTYDELAQSELAKRVLGQSSPYVPTAKDKATATRYSKGAGIGGRPDEITQGINRFFGSGEFAGTRDYIPESVLGNRLVGVNTINDAIGAGLSTATKLAGALFTRGGFNPFQRTPSKEKLAEAEKAAYEKSISSSAGAERSKRQQQERDDVLRLAARLINERGQEMSARGITPFTRNLGQVSSILGGTNIPIVKK